MNKAHRKAYASAIATAALSRSAALQCELAVAFAVQLEVGESKRLARATLVEIYAQAGYQCSDPKSIDWLSVGRRITAGLALFDFMGRTEVEGWVKDAKPSEMINAIADKLKPLKLKTVNEVLLTCEKVKPPKKRAMSTTTPAEAPGTLHVESQHLRISIPPDTTSDELLQVAAKLIALAQKITATTTIQADVEHTEEHKELVAA